MKAIAILIITLLLMTTATMAYETEEKSFFGGLFEKISSFFSNIFGGEEEAVDIVEDLPIINNTVNEVVEPKVVINVSEDNLSIEPIIEEELNISDEEIYIIEEIVNITPEVIAEPKCDGITDDLGEECRAKDWEAALEGEPIPYFDSCDRAQEWYEGSVLGPRASCDEVFKECYEDCSNEDWYLVCDMSCSESGFAKCYNRCSPVAIDTSCDSKCD